MITIFTVIFLLQFTYSHGFHIQPRIINGHRSNPQDFTFYVGITSFTVKNNQVYTGLCGASLISDRFIFYFLLLRISLYSFFQNDLCSSTDGFYQRLIASKMWQRFKHHLELMQKVIFSEMF